MSFDSREVANRFLKFAETRVGGMTPMKLLKLVYFAHGWNLALTGAPLVTEPFEAWEYGPVVRRLYSEFRSFGDQPITRPATRWVITDGKIRQAEFDIPECEPEYEFTHRLLARVWAAYGEIGAIQLSNLSHDPVGPWARTREANPGDRSPVIPNEEIRAYFATKLA